MLGCVGRKVGGGEKKQEWNEKGQLCDERERMAGKEGGKQLNIQNYRTQKSQFVLGCKSHCTKRLNDVILYHGHGKM